MTQFFPPAAGDLDNPGLDAFAVTPSDSEVFEFFTRAIYVGGTGTLVVVTAYGTEVTLTAVPTGTIIPLAVKQIKATGTTATEIVGFI